MVYPGKVASAPRRTCGSAVRHLAFGTDLPCKRLLFLIAAVQAEQNQANRTTAFGHKRTNAGLVLGQSVSIELHPASPTPIALDPQNEDSACVP